MQKCLQRTRKIKTVCTLLCTGSFLVSALILTKAPDIAVDNTALYYKRSGKYLDKTSEYTLQTFSEKQEVQTQQDVKMNNLETENAKNEQNDTQNPKNAVFDGHLSGKVGVFNHKTGKTQSLDIEEYTLGVTLAEMPSSFGHEALMAQAVAIRTFTVRKMLYEDNDKKHKGANVCTDPAHCQSYISPDEYLKKGEYAKNGLEKVKQCVNSTKGIIAVYEKMPILAVYHASSGHNTKSSKEVWGGEVPYLVSVKAPEDLSVSQKTYTFDYKTLSKKLTNYSKTYVECFYSGQSAVVVNKNTNGTCESIDVGNKNFDKNFVRNALSLRSDDFEVKCTQDTVTVTTYGNGHMVGLSQHGANALSENGKNYIQILEYYYPGTNLSYIY